MNREIKFRAFDPLTPIMIFFDFEDLLTKVVPLHPGSCDWTLMQYTGLKDKNGKEIYEGDFIYYQYEDVPNEFVRWDNDNGCWQTSENGLCGTDLTDNAVVIGNIYETPELIKNN
jgi:hypothetical protein